MLALAIHIIEGIFVVGLVGSALVVILTGIEDIKMLFGLDHDGRAPKPER